MPVFAPLQPDPEASTRDLIAFARATAEVGDRVRPGEPRRRRRPAGVAACLAGLIGAVIAVKATG